MLLYLVRHGMAEARAATDAERELTAEGIAGNQAVVNEFTRRSPALERGLVSPYVRARQTAAQFEQAFPGLEFEVTDAITPDRDPQQVMALIERYGEQDLIVVAHPPLLSDLLSLLVDGAIAGGHAMGTSNLVCVAMDVVAPGCGEINYALRP